MEIYNWATRHHVSPAALQELIMIAPVTVDPNATSESQTQAQLRILAPKHGNSLWRNNTGAAVDADGRHIRYGLGNDSKRLNKTWKSSDLIGITRMSSTAVGQVFGVFTAVEVKSPGWTHPKNERERAQAAFIGNIRALGGIATFAQSETDYLRAVGK